MDLKRIKIVICSVGTVIACMIIVVTIRFFNDSTEDPQLPDISTQGPASTTTTKLIDENHQKNLPTVDTLTSATGTELETYSDREYFRLPSQEGVPHLTGAAVKKLVVQNCDACDITIIDRIDGVSEELVQRLNLLITEGIISENTTDLRNSSYTFHLDKDIESVDHFTFTITYIDQGIVGYTTSYEMYSPKILHPSRNPGSSGFFFIKDNQIYRDYELSLFTNNNKDAQRVLSQFYPNGSGILKGIIEEDVAECIDPGDFPEAFKPSLNVNTGEVVFEKVYPYATIGPCTGFLQIAIPVPDILQKTPQFVPSDSVLRQVGTNTDSLQ